MGLAIGVIAAGSSSALAAGAQDESPISVLTPYIAGPGASGKLGALNIRPIGFQSEIEVDTVRALSARLSGLQLGVRYADTGSWPAAPDLKLECAVCGSDSGSWLSPLPGSLELGVNYAGAIDGLSLELAGSYFAAEPERTAISAASARAWGIGGKIGIKLPGSSGALALGGSFSARNYVSLTGAAGKLAGLVTGSMNAWDWDAGLSYSYGSWMLGGYYQTAQVDITSALAGQLSSLSPSQAGRAISVQGGYRVLPGFALSAGVEFWAYEDAALRLSAPGRDRPRDSSSTVVFLETSLDF